MAIGLFKLSKRQRHFLSTVFISLNVIQILTGIIMIILAVYIYVAVAPALYSERAELNYVFTVICFCGINNCFTYLFGIRICQKFSKQAQKKSTRSLVFAWSCVSFYVIFYLVILAIMSRKVYKHIIRSMKHSLHIGMTNYLKDNVWKLTIDRLQYDMQCCGIKNHQDWHEIEWLTHYHINIKSDSVKQLSNGTTMKLPVTPWSCCRLNIPMQCLHDPLQQTRAANLWNDQPNLVLDTIHTNGCIDKLKMPVQSTITTFVLIVVLNCFIQVMLFCLVRILYTSFRNAILLSDPDGIGPGWIFGRGDFGYSRGKTLAEIMLYPRRSKRKSVKKLKSKQNQEHEEQTRLLIVPGQTTDEHEQ